jgi:hypothetical protein
MPQQNKISPVYKKENSDLEDIDELVIDHCIFQVPHAIFSKKTASRISKFQNTSNL